MDKNRKTTEFRELSDEGKDLTMFKITNLVLTNEDDMVHMVLNLKRKVVTELMTTYLPTILLLLITLVTIFFDKDLFGEGIAVNQGWPYYTESLMGGGVPKIITIWHGRVGV